MNISLGSGVVSMKLGVRKNYGWCQSRTLSQESSLCQEERGGRKGSYPAVFHFEQCYTDCPRWYTAGFWELIIQFNLTWYFYFSVFYF